MVSLRIGIGVIWGLFWIGWLISAFTAKHGTGSSRMFGARMMGARIAAIVVIVATRGLWHRAGTIDSWPLAIVGTVLLLCGLGTAVWARVAMGDDWGMPMTLKDEPELVETGPFRYIRHPIYSGLILAFAGTTMATSLVILIPLLVGSAYFVWSAHTEEQILSEAMPSTYPQYMRRTKMLVPFLF
jgi:protein-S-isoprenylcysteine O-methyltransferase Ste14